MFHHRVCNKKDSGGAWGLLPADTLCGDVKSNLCGWQQQLGPSPEAEFLDEIQTRVLRLFLLAIHWHLYSFALRFLFLPTPATSYSFYSSVTVHFKGGKPDRKPYPLPYGLRNPYINPSMKTLKIMPRNLK